MRLLIILAGIVAFAAGAHRSKRQYGYNNYYGYQYGQPYNYARQPANYGYYRQPNYGYNNNYYGQSNYGYNSYYNRPVSGFPGSEWSLYNREHGMLPYLLG